MIAYKLIKEDRVPVKNIVNVHSCTSNVLDKNGNNLVCSVDLYGLIWKAI